MVSVYELLVEEPLLRGFPRSAMTCNRPTPLHNDPPHHELALVMGHDCYSCRPSTKGDVIDRVVG